MFSFCLREPFQLLESQWNAFWLMVTELQFILDMCCETHMSLFPRVFVRGPSMENQRTLLENGICGGLRGHLWAFGMVDWSQRIGPYDFWFKKSAVNCNVDEQILSNDVDFQSQLEILHIMNLQWWFVASAICAFAKSSCCFLAKHTA